MPKVWKRKDRDVWVVDYRDATGKRIREVAGMSRAEAENKLAERIKEFREFAGNLADRDILLKDYVARWLGSIADQLAQRTIRSYGQLFELHIVPVLGGVKVRELRRRDVKKLLADKRQTLGKNSVRLIKAALSTVLSQAVEEEIITVNPALGRFRESRSASNSRQSDVNPMSHDQLNRFKQTVERLVGESLIPPGLGMGFLMMTGTGLRPSELMALRPTDLDIPGRTVRIERSLDMDGQIKPTKTEETRLVDLSRRLTSKLSDYLTWLDSEAIARGKDQTEWLFVDDKWNVYNERYLRKAFARILRKAELPHFKPYDLRHTYASLLLSEGVPLVYVSQQLGHAKPTTTLKHYAKWMPSGNRRYVDILDREIEKSWHQKLAPKAEIMLKAETAEAEVLENSSGKDGGPCRGRTYGPLIKSLGSPFRSSSLSSSLP
jgi:integrase